MLEQNWMAELAHHHNKTRRQYPEDRLLILFDIDGTILDMRYMVLRVLQSFDREYHTRFFRKMQVVDIKVHENQVDRLLADLQIPSDKQGEILDWYNQHRWSSENILHSHNPLSGVLEVIRWFQLQPNTFVGLNTGRPESIRTDTLRSLNELGKEYKVQFADELLHMNSSDWEQEVGNAKVAGVYYFQKAGYRVFAFIDNEPDNLKAVSKINPIQEILLLHANTIFESRRTSLPSHTVKGKTYDLTELIPEKALPRHIQFVWHGVNDEVNLRQFLASDITWGECDVRLDPIGNELILRHDSFVKNPLDLDEEWLSLDRLLERLCKTGKSVKLDLKAGGILVDRVLEFITKFCFEDVRLWFNGNVERLQEEGFRKLADAHPDSVLQCPVDFLAPLIISAPEKAKDILDMFTSWGANRFSIDWNTQNLRTFFDQMDEWGFEVNIYNVPDLEAFLQAVLLIPRSITSDFNFPKWHYYGRGSGQDSEQYEYTVHKTSRKK
jgi:hypothetical protein